MSPIPIPSRHSRTVKTWELHYFFRIPPPPTPPLSPRSYPPSLLPLYHHQHHPRLSKSQFEWATKICVKKYCGNKIGQNTPQKITKININKLINCAFPRLKIQILRNLWKCLHNCTLAWSHLFETVDHPQAGPDRAGPEAGAGEPGSQLHRARDSFSTGKPVCS